MKLPCKWMLLILCGYGAVKLDMVIALMFWHIRKRFPGRASTVRLVGALSDLDDIAVRIADVAADLAVLGQRLRDELGSSTLP